MNFKDYTLFDYLIALIIIYLVGGILILIYQIFHSKENNNKSIFKCPKCGSPMEKMYDNDKAHEIAQKSKLASYLKDAYEFQLLRIFVCTKCKFNKELKTGEIIKGFIKMRKHKGISTKDIIKEVEAERKKMEKGE